MDINECFPSKYLKAADIMGKRLECKIDRIEQGDETVAHKPIMHLVGKDRGVVLNKTNAMNLAAVYGTETNAWAGCTIILSTHKVQNQMGVTVDGIQVEAKQQVQPLDEDDIPF